MSSAHWSDAFLNDMRETGDPLADDTIAAVFAQGNTAGVPAVLDTLTRNDDPLPKDVPEAVRQYFESVGGMPTANDAMIVAGQQLFADYGPEMLLVLACYSLPASYAAEKGVQVLYRTGFLAKRPNRRLLQTTQMVVDVMTPEVSAAMEGGA